MEAGSSDIEMERQPAETDRADLRPFAPFLANLGRATVLAIVVVNILNAYAIIAGPREGERYWFLLATETSPATWLSVSMLLGCGLLAGACAVVDPSRRTFWYVVMAALFAMSLDDGATIHERLGGNISVEVGDVESTFLWVIPWAAIAVGTVVALVRLRPGLPRWTSARLLAGGGITVGAAVVLEVVATLTVNDGGTDTQKLVLYSIEENLEMLGVLLVAYTCVRYALSLGHAPEPRDQSERSP